jgi:MFS transporter, DHA3 family, macrolide efflux protein
MNHPTEPKTQSLRPFLILWSGQAASLFGSQLVQFALIWWLTQETGSATVLALASLVGLLPQVILGPFVGVLVDRWNRRLTMLLSDGTVALATAVLALLFWSGQIQVWHVFTVLFVRSLAGAFHWPAMQASTSLMVPKAQLARIQGLNQTLNGALNIVSAPLGALLLAVLPIQGVLAIDLVTAGIGIFILALTHVPQPVKRVNGGNGRFLSEFWADMVAGLRYVWSWPALMLLMGMAMMINLVLTPAFSLLPILVTDHFGGEALQLGFMQSAFGLGLLLGGLLLGIWGGFKKRVYTSLFGLIGMGLATLFLGLVPSDFLFLAAVAFFLVGANNSLVNGPFHAIFQATVAPEMQGRVFTLIGSLAAGMAPLGLIIAGPVADWLGVQTWYLIGGLVTLSMGVFGFFVPMILRVEDGAGGTAVVLATSNQQPATSD